VHMQVLPYVPDSFSIYGPPVSFPVPGGRFPLLRLRECYKPRLDDRGDWILHVGEAIWIDALGVVRAGLRIRRKLVLLHRN